MAGVVPCAAGYSAPACWRRPGLPTSFCFEEGGGELAHCQDAVECRLARVELRVVLRDLAYVSLSANARLVGEVGLQVQKRCAHRRGQPEAGEHTFSRAVGVNVVVQQNEGDVVVILGFVPSVRGCGLCE